MAFLTVFKSGYVDALIYQLSRGSGAELFESDSTPPFEDADVLPPNRNVILADDIELKMPENNNNYDFENAVKVYEYLEKINTTQASDHRLWTYLSNRTFWDYMRKRWPVPAGTNTEKTKHILGYWFLPRLSATGLSRHGISWLWWCVYMTVDETREDKYELTKEMFSMLDYTRTLLQGSLGRDKNFFKAILSYVIENEDLFKSKKQDKIRYLMRKLNFMASYKSYSTLSDDEIKGCISKYRGDLEKENIYQIQTSQDLET
jgi:hypothetical protein